ncbi:MAG: FIST N-terminal domain-containing protein [Thermodesulfovibrionales bacterium]
METVVGVGYCVKRNLSGAGKEAALKALEHAGIAKPDFVFVFATVGYNQNSLIHSFREATSKAPLRGCSGEGIITRGMAGWN